MPARTVNKGWDFVANNGVKGKSFHIKVPYPVLVLVKLDCYVDKEACGDIVPTSNHSIMANFEDRDKIIEDFKKQGYDVDVQQTTFGPLIDLCQKCGKRGIPSIQKKNTDQAYSKVNTESTSINFGGKIIKVPKPKTYWLTYRHNSGLCWVRQWQGTIHGTFKHTKKGKYIHPKDFMISGQIKNLEQLSNR